MAFDFETTGLRPYHGDRAFAYAAGRRDSQFLIERLEDSSSFQRLRGFVLNCDMEKVCHNAKFEISFCEIHGIHIPYEQQGLWHDTMIMAQLLDNLMPSYGLDDIAKRLCDYPTDVDKEVQEIAKKLGGYQKVPKKLMLEYQRRDIERTLILDYTFWPEIQSDSALLADYRNELMLSFATARMESRGLSLSQPICEELIQELGDKKEAISQSVTEMVGGYYNLNSDKDVGELLYKVLKLPVLSLTEKSKSPAVDKDALAQLQELHPNPVLSMIREYKSYSHGIGIINGYLKARTAEGIVHPSIKQNGARTGRQSSSGGVNLHNVQKTGTNKEAGYSVPARRCYHPRDWHRWLLGDYAGIELRLITEITQEPEFVELINRNGDPHALAAEVLYSGADKKFDGSKEMRGWAKNTQFAIAYGAGLAKVAAALHISIKEAAPGYAEYCRRFPLVKGFTERMASEVKELGYITTSFGRRLRLNPEKAYTASNFIIQGTAAGILKRAQVAADKYILDNYPGKLFMIISIHDEIIFEMSRELDPLRVTIMQDIGKLMVDMPQIKIPLAVEWKDTVTTWEEAKKVVENKRKLLLKRRDMVCQN